HLDPNTDEGCPMYYQDEKGNLRWQPTGSVGLHGRIGAIPAKHLSLCEWWDGDDYWMSVSGQMRETAVFGSNLVLKRTIRAKLGDTKIWIDDVVENQGHDPAEHMYLYHCNFGFPILSDGAEYLINSRSTEARDEDAAPHIDTLAQFPAPTPNQVEWVYYHDLATDDGENTAVAIVNRDFNGGQGFGGYLRFSKQQLPNLIQWKMPAEGTYVTGLEPANCLVEGRTKDREEGRLVTLQPGESAEYSLEVGVLANNDEIDALGAEIAKMS
ncbi:MAG: aldose 1-epimerase family protein, partial [Armatimonadota bacterium]